MIIQSGIESEILDK